jgi:hypothetical protein
MASNDAMLLHAQGVNQNLGKLVETITTRFALAATTGSFVLGAAANTTVNDVNVKANSIIFPIPNTAPAALIMGSAKSLYVSAKVAGTSFVVSTGDGTPASGGQSFSYIIFNAG